MTQTKKKKTGKETVYAKARRLGLRYVGKDNAHMTGIPVADISPMQVSFIGDGRIEAVMASGLYEFGKVNNE